MNNFTPWASLLGGVLIGLSASVVLLTTGRIAGVSGILGGILHRALQDTAWRVAFITGLIFAGGLGYAIAPQLFDGQPARSLPLVFIAGLFVGFGTRLGNGCTSGHGICGLSRFSVRSLVSVLTFMATGAATVFVVNHVIGGAK